MKSTAKLVLLVIALMVTTLSSLEAQRGERRSPEDQAERQTTMMNDSLTLSTAQLKKVNEINLKYAKVMSESRQEARKNMDPDGDRQAMRESMRAMMQKIQDERKGELKVILTTEQMAKYEKIEANRKARRGERGKRGGRKGKRGKKDKDRT